MGSRTNFLHEAIRSIAFRATPLFERPESACGDLQKAGLLFDRWEKILGGSAALDRRLASERLSRNDVHCRLTPTECLLKWQMPEWGYLLVDILNNTANLFESTDSINDRAFSADEKYPFQEVFIGFIHYARKQIKNSENKPGLLSTRAQVSFERQLLNELTFQSSLALGLRFELFRAEHDLRSFLNLPLEQSTEIYNSFILQMLSDQLIDFFQEYAVLARLLSVTIEQWIANIQTFRNRLSGDLIEIEQEFFAGQSVGCVTDVRTRLSDRHLGGQSVIEVRFESGSRLIYKPRSLAPERNYFRVINWLNEKNGSLLPLRCLHVLDKGVYGWVEYVHHLECTSLPEVENYYRRAGMLAAIALALRASDLHCENLIASGCHPIVVDLETLMQPKDTLWARTNEKSADEAVQATIRESVLGTGLLPRWHIGPAGQVFDRSGICASEYQNTGFIRRVWQFVNTDCMRLIEYRATSGSGKSGVRFFGQFISARDHLGVFLKGFSKVYKLLARSKEEILRLNGPLGRLAGIPIRILIRETATYAELLFRLLHPEFLRDGVERSIEIERLARNLFTSRYNETQRAAATILRAEREAMEMTDVPYFTTNSASRQLNHGNERLLDDYLERTGFDDMKSRLIEMDESDLCRQIRMVELAFRARYDEPHVSGDLAGSPCPSLPASARRQELLAVATSLGQRICRDAIWGADGTVSWLCLKPRFATGSLWFEPVADDFYGGRSGIALFMAAFSKIGVEDSTFHELARSCFANIEVRLKKDFGIRYSHRLGAGSGLGGIIYSLAKVADFLSEDGYLELARNIARLISEELIAQDDSFDVIDGAAGGILGLLSLATDDAAGDAALRKATACGEHLLRKRVVTESGNFAWKPAWASRPLSGFAHGSAGIAYALARLADATGNDRFYKAACDAFHHEHILFSPSARNWPDLRGEDSANRSMTSWCCGAPGVGLALLSSVRIFEAGNFQGDLAEAIETTRSFPLQGSDHLCCGNFGRIDFLLESSRRLIDDELLDLSRRQSSVAMQKWLATGDDRGGYEMSVKLADPSLFRGMAGIGYALLRQVNTTLPNLLAWQ